MFPICGSLAETNWTSVAPRFNSCCISTFKAKSNGGNKSFVFHGSLQIIVKRQQQLCYLHEDLHAIADVISGSVKIILQDVKKTQFLAVMHFYEGFSLFHLHSLINESQQGLVTAPMK